MSIEDSNLPGRATDSSTALEERRFSTTPVEGTPATVVRRQIEVSDAYDAIANVLERTPDVELEADPAVQSLDHGDQAAGYRVTYETTSDRASDLVATLFDGDDEPLVSLALTGGDGGPVRYYYRANADSLERDGRDVSVQREPLASYTADEPTVDGHVPLPKSVSATLELVGNDPRVNERATITARRSQAQGTEGDSDDPVRIVAHEWDLDGDGTFEYQPDASGNIGDATLEHPRNGTYDEHGPQTVQVRVHGSNGESDTATLEFEVLRDDSPQAVVTQEAVPPNLRRSEPGMRRFSAKDTEFLEAVERIRWNFAYEGGSNSGQVNGDPSDSVRTVERPNNGWAEYSVTELYNYDIAGTYTIHLEVFGEDGTTDVATEQIEVADTGVDQFDVDLVHEPLSDEGPERIIDRGSERRYVAKNPRVLTEDGWQAYDGSFTWRVDGTAEVVNGSNVFWIAPKPYQDIELTAVAEADGRTYEETIVLENTKSTVSLSLSAYDGRRDDGTDCNDMSVYAHARVWKDGDWQSYDGTYEWSYSDREDEATTENRRCLNAPMEVEVTISANNDSVTDTIFLGDLLQLEVDKSANETPSRDNCPQAVEVKATAKHYDDGEWVDYDGTFEWTYEQTGNTIEEQSVGGISVLCIQQSGKITATVRKDGQSRSQTVSVTTTSPQEQGLNLSIDRTVDADTIQGNLEDNTDDSVDQELIENTADGVSYHSGIQFVNPEEPVTFTAERTWGTDEVVNSYEWAVAGELVTQNGATDQLAIGSGTGETFQQEFPAPGATIVDKGPERNPEYRLNGAYYVFVRADLEDRIQTAFTSVIARDPDASIATSIGYRHQMGGDVTADRTMMQSAADSLDVAVGSASDRTAIATLRDPAHPGPRYVHDTTSQ